MTQIECPRLLPCVLPQRPKGMLFCCPSNPAAPAIPLGAKSELRTMSQLVFRISVGVLLTMMFILLIVIIGGIHHSVPPIVQSATPPATGSGSSIGSAGITFLAIYFLPAIIAAVRGHLNKNAICVLNIFLGWTILGWIVALVWSATNPAGAK